MSLFSQISGPATYESAQFEAAIDEARGLPPRRYANYLLSGQFDLLTTTLVDVQDQGGITVLPTAAAPVVLVSSDAGDNFAGAGAQVVLVRGVGAGFAGNPNGLWQDELVVMNGTTPVQTVQPYLRAIFERVVVAGSHDGNLGNIDASIGGNLQLRIGFDAISTRGNSSSHAMKFVVPAGWTAHLRQLHIGWGENQAVKVWFGSRLFGVESFGVIENVSASDAIATGIVPLLPGLDLIGRARRLSGGGAPIGLVTDAVLVRIGT